MSDEMANKSKEKCCEGAHEHSLRDPECLRIFAQLSDYVDGELAEADYETIRRHICDCPPCVEFVESLRESIRAARALSVEEKPVALAKETQERLRAIWTDAMQRRGASAS